MVLASGRRALRVGTSTATAAACTAETVSPVVAEAEAVAQAVRAFVTQMVVAVSVRYVPVLERVLLAMGAVAAEPTWCAVEVLKMASGKRALPPSVTPVAQPLRT